jgi:CelD/BcsL family acetyltransferase involved in cellulose biosynthesis
MPPTSATSTRSELALRRALRPPPTLRIRAVDDLDDRELAAWSELAARAIEPNPFFEPEALRPAAALYGGVALGLIEAGGDLVGLLPLRRGRRWRRIPGSSLAAWCHPDCFLGTPLLAPEAPAASIGALIDGADAGLLALEWIGMGGPVEAAVVAAAAERGIDPIRYEAFERAALVRRPDPTYLAETVSKRRAREQRRLRRQLAEAVGEPLEVHDRTGDDEALEGFLRAEATGWKGTTGSHFLSTPRYAAFFRDMCARFTAAGRMQLLVLRGGDDDIAWKVNFCSGDAIFCFKIAYDVRFARFSPGIQLELDFVELFHGTPAAWCDSCAAPDNQMINRLWPDRRSLATLLIPARGARGAAARQSVRAVMAARRRIRRTDEQAA